MTAHAWVRDAPDYSSVLEDDDQPWTCERCGCRVVAVSRAVGLIVGFSEGRTVETETAEQAADRYRVDPDCDVSTVSGVMLS